MSNHAFLSPSSSHRWLNCTPSAVLESKFENKSTKASEEGTVAHAWCEHKLKNILCRKSDEPVSPYTNDEMPEYTDLYVDFVLEQFNLAKQKCKDPLILIEQKVLEQPTALLFLKAKYISLISNMEWEYWLMPLITRR